MRADVETAGVVGPIDAVGGECLGDGVVAHERHVSELLRIAGDDAATGAQQRRRRGDLVDLGGLVDDHQVEHRGGPRQQVVDVAERARPTAAARR